MPSLNNIEHGFCSKAHPVNSKAMLSRMLELLDELRTNSALSDSVRQNWRWRACLHMLCNLTHGQLHTIDSIEEYTKIMQLKEADPEADSNARSYLEAV